MRLEARAGPIYDREEGPGTHHLGEQREQVDNPPSVPSACADETGVPRSCIRNGNDGDLPYDQISINSGILPA